MLRTPRYEMDAAQTLGPRRPQREAHKILQDCFSRHPPDDGLTRGTIVPFDESWQCHIIDPRAFVREAGAVRGGAIGRLAQIMRISTPERLTLAQAQAAAAGPRSGEECRRRDFL